MILLKSTLNNIYINFKIIKRFFIIKFLYFNYNICINIIKSRFYNKNNNIRKEKI